MNQDACSFDMAQELMAEARAFACPFDESGDIGNDAAAVVPIDDA